MSGQGPSDPDLAALATAGVIAVEELLSAIEASHKNSNHATSHLGHAAIGVAVAVCALELLRRDEAAGKDGSYNDDAKTHHHDKEAPEMTPPGHKKHQVAHAVAEVLDAILQNTKDHLHGMES
jgi:hypothetical protein